MKTLKELLKETVLNPESIVIKNKKGEIKEYFLTSHLAIGAGIEIMVIEIIRNGCNVPIQNITIRKEDIDTYPIKKLVSKILYYCNKYSNEPLKKLTTLEKLHEIEKEKIIYNIHYCRAGVGIIFYYPAKAPKYLLTKEDILPNNWKKGLNVETYYPTFEEAVEAEYNKLKESEL